jgi:phosphatidylinositol alpha-mannosyltransferase
MNGRCRLAGPGFETVVRLRNELRAGSFDVVHVHEPITPLVGWDAACFDGAPVVRTFHAYSEVAERDRLDVRARRIFSKLSADRVSGRRPVTGERYWRPSVIPNGWT